MRKCRHPVAGGLLFLGTVLRRERALMRTDAQVIPHAHRQAVGEEIGDADDQPAFADISAAGDAGDYRERRDDAVICAIDRIANVVASDSGGTSRLDMHRRSASRRDAFTG